MSLTTLFVSDEYKFYIKRECKTDSNFVVAARIHSQIDCSLVVQNYYLKKVVYDPLIHVCPTLRWLTRYINSGSGPIACGPCHTWTSIHFHDILLILQFKMSCHANPVIFGLKSIWSSIEWLLTLPYGMFCLFWLKITFFFGR